MSARFFPLLSHTRFNWLVVSVQCGLSVTKYWLIKMMLREEMVWFTKPRICLTSIDWLSIYLYERKRENDSEKKQVSPRSLSYIISIFVRFRSSSSSLKREEEKKDLLIEKKREKKKENWQTQVTTDSPLKRFFSLLTWSYFIAIFFLFLFNFCTLTS